MGQWISSKKFALQYNIKLDTLLKNIQRHNRLGKKICRLIGKYFPIQHICNQEGGNSGKVLQIWSEPFASETEADEFITNYRINRLENAVKARVIESKYSFHSKRTRYNNGRCSGF